MAPITLDDSRYRARLSQNLAALLCGTVAAATLIRPLIVELSPWLTTVGILNTLIWLAIYRLIGSGRLEAQAPAVLTSTASAMLLCVMVATGMSNSQFSVIVPTLPMLGMLLGGARMSMTVAGFWSLCILIDLLAPSLLQGLSDAHYDPDKSKARSIWLLLSTLVASVFSLYAERALTQLKLDLQRQASTDPLTALPNRRGLDASMGWEMARAARQQQSLSVLMVDVDYFKRFNDSHGHEAGDRALQQLARTLKASVRAGQDLVTRFGGEEFVVVLTNSDCAAAQVAAEHVRRAVAAMPRITNDQLEPLTVTIGGATLDPPMALQMPSDQRQNQFEDLLRRADEALYEGKSRGRDRVVIAT